MKGLPTSVILGISFTGWVRQGRKQAAVSFQSLKPMKLNVACEEIMEQPPK